MFSVDNILLAKKQSITETLEFFNVENISQNERQYKDLVLVNWDNFSDTTSFRKEVFLYKDSGGNRRFLDLSMVALQILSLPWSNAEIERVFQVNLLKSKL